MTIMETIIKSLADAGKRMVMQDWIIAYLAAAGKRAALRDVVAATGYSRRQVLRFMDKLASEGYLLQISDEPEPPRAGEVGPPRRNPTWRIVKDLATRPAPNRTVNDSNRSRLWRLVRAKRRFTRHDLTVCSGIPGKTVDGYVRDLERAGHVRATGKDGQHTTYMLVTLNQVDPPTGLYRGGK